MNSTVDPVLQRAQRVRQIRRYVSILNVVIIAIAATLVLGTTDATGSPRWLPAVNWALVALVLELSALEAWELFAWKRVHRDHPDLEIRQAAQGLVRRASIRTALFILFAVFLAYTNLTRARHSVPAQQSVTLVPDLSSRPS